MPLLINMTIITTVTALLILLVKKVFAERMTPKCHLAIWLILLLQVAALPMGNLLPGSGMSLRNYVPTLENVRVKNLPEDKAQGTSYLESTVYSGEITMRTPITGQTFVKEIAVNKLWAGVYRDIIMAIWKAGGAVFLGCLIFGSVRFRRKCRKMENVTDRETLTLFENCKERLGISGSIALKKGGCGAMLSGVLRPTICISESYQLAELRHVLIHELCHYKHKDVLISMGAAALLCAFWYNPVMWWCFHEVRKDVEVYCDHRTIEATGEKKEYAAVLLKTAAGKNHFVFATTSLLSGEKEVSKRIKHIAGFKKPGVWLGILAAAVIIFVGVLALTGGVGTGNQKMETVIYPTPGELGSIMFSVPEDWIAMMEEVPSGVEQGAGQNLSFRDEDGNPFTGTLCLEMAKGERADELTAWDMASKLKTALAAQNAAHTAGAKGSTAEIPNIEGDIRFTEESVPVKNDLISIYYTADIPYEGKTYSFAVGAGGEAYCLWADADYASREELLDILGTVRVCNGGDDYSYAVTSLNYDSLGASGAGSGKDGTETLEAEQTLLMDRLDAYAAEDLPIEMDIKAYKINSIGGEYNTYSKEAGDTFHEIPQVLDDRVQFADQAVWSVIYPSAKVLRVDYELIPYLPNRFKDTAGGGFEMIPGGNKRYQERYAVFAENVYSDSEELDDLYFLGFLQESNVAEYGMDASALLLLNKWYDDIIYPVVEKEYHTPYIGKAQDVGRLVMALPLAESIDTGDGTFTSKALVLQTTAEPYGLTINYWSDYPLYDLTGTTALLSSGKGGASLPPNPSANVNAYVQLQIQENIEHLFKGIDNLGSVTVNMWCQRDPSGVPAENVSYNDGRTYVKGTVAYTEPLNRGN